MENLTTEQKIHVAADLLVEKGVKPTLAAVRAEMEGGSFSTISEAMKSWKKAKSAVADVAAVSVPANVLMQAEQGAKAVWLLAEEVAEAKLEAEKEGLAEALGEFEEAKVAADREAMKLNQAILELQQENESLKEARINQNEELQQGASRLAMVEKDMEVAVAKVKRELEVSVTAVTELKEEVQTLSLREKALISEVSDIKEQNAKFSGIAEAKAGEIERQQQAISKMNAEAQVFNNELTGLRAAKAENERIIVDFKGAQVAANSEESRLNKYIGEISSKLATLEGETKSQASEIDRLALMVQAFSTIVKPEVKITDSKKSKG